MKISRVAPLLLLVVLLFACGEEPTSPVKTNEPMPQIVELPFSLQDLLDSMDILEEEPLFVSPELDGDPIVLPVGTYDRYAVEITWGVLGEGPTTELAAMDWTGGVMLNSPGVIIPTQVIDFEDGEDWLMRINTLFGLGWVSKTADDFDGVLLDVYVRTDIMTLVIPELMLKMIPFEHRWNMMELADLDEVYDVDNTHQVAIKSTKVEAGGCPRGRIAGKWLFKSRHAGYFFGHWLTQFGAVRGFLYGRFWTNDDGGRSFEGYWIGCDHHFKGQLKGTWEFDTNTSATLTEAHRPKGHFRGRFTNEDGTLVGHLKGRFGYPCSSDLSVSNQNGWPTGFVGEWRVDCPDLTGL